MEWCNFPNVAYVCKELNDISPCNHMSYPPVAENVTLFENRVTANVTS